MKKTYPKIISIWEEDLIEQPESYLLMNFYQEEIDTIFNLEHETIDEAIQTMFENNEYKEDTPYHHIEDWNKEKEKYIDDKTYDFEFDEKGELQKVEVSDEEYKKYEKEFEAKNPEPVLLHFDISKFYKPEITVV